MRRLGWVLMGLALASQATTLWAADLSKAYRSKNFPPDSVLLRLPDMKKHIREYPSGYVSSVEFLGKIEESPSVYTLYCAEVLKMGSSVAKGYTLFNLKLKHLDTDYWIVGDSLLENP